MKAAALRPEPVFHCWDSDLCAERAGYRFEPTYYIMIHNNLQNIIRNRGKAAVGTRINGNGSRGAERRHRNGAEQREESESGWEKFY